MARMARVVAAGVPHHVTQRGNRRQKVFFHDGDYKTYLALLAESCAAARVAVWAYCLMPNHVHLILVPRDAGGPRWPRRIAAIRAPSISARAGAAICGKGVFLFSDGRGVSAGMRPLHRTQSGAGAAGGVAARLGLVQRTGASERAGRWAGQCRTIAGPGWRLEGLFG